MSIAPHITAHHMPGCQSAPGRGRPDSASLVVEGYWALGDWQEYN